MPSHWRFGDIKMRDNETVWRMAGYVIKPALESSQNWTMTCYPSRRDTAARPARGENVG